MLSLSMLFFIKFSSIEHLSSNKINYRSLQQTPQSIAFVLVPSFLKCGCYMCFLSRTSSRYQNVSRYILQCIISEKMNSFHSLLHNICVQRHWYIYLLEIAIQWKTGVQHFPLRNRHIWNIQHSRSLKHFVECLLILIDSQAIFSASNPPPPPTIFPSVCLCDALHILHPLR